MPDERLTLQQYQNKALRTFATGRDDSKGGIITRLTLGLCGESGEVAEVVKKYNRGDFNLDYLQQRLRGELGDILWYIATLSWWLGFSLEDIGNFNLDKLLDRKDRGTIKGSGEDR